MNFSVFDKAPAKAYPSCLAEASAAGSLMVDVESLPSAGVASALAGNGMHVAQAGALLMIAALFLEKK